MELEVGSIVLCTVDKIIGTTVFVMIEGDGEGSIVVSEIAPGRIRNLRDYVVPKKKIVCKVLRISEKNVELSLRRVSLKEKKERMEELKQEKSYKSILKTILKEKTEEAIKKITESSSVYDFLQEAKKDSSKLEKITDKDSTQKILDIINTQKIKTSQIKKQLEISTEEPNGIELIKNLLTAQKDLEIKYVSAGKYSIKTSGEDLKKADKKILDFVEEIKEKSKDKKIKISVTEK